MSSSPSTTETIVLGGGCFWCTLAAYRGRNVGFSSCLVNFW